MSREFEPKLPHQYLLRTIAAAGLALGPSTPMSQETFFDKPTTLQNRNTYELKNWELEESTHSLQEKEDKDEELTNLLKDDNIRALVAAGLLFSLLYLAQASRLADKYDEKKLKALRISVPATMSLAFASLALDSATAIDRHIPTSLFTSSAFLQAAYNVVNTFEREHSRKTQVAAIATSTALITLGITALYAAENV